MLRGPPRRDTVRCRLCGEEFVKRSFPFHLKSCARVHFVDLPAPHSGGVAVASAAPALDVVEWWREFVVASCNPAEDVPVGGGRGVGRGPSAEPSAAVAQHRRVGEDGDAAGATEPEGGKAATAPAHDRDHLVEPLVPCAYCGRTFFASRIQVHEDVCRVARERDSMRRTASVGLRGNRPGGTGKSRGASLSLERERRGKEAEAGAAGDSASAVVAGDAGSATANRLQGQSSSPTHRRRQAARRLRSGAQENRGGQSPPLLLSRTRY